MTASGAAWPGGSPRAKQLDADLGDLGADLGPLEPAPETLSPGQAWGVQYVLEGSRLGGRLLAGRLAPDAPRRYLADAAPQGAGGRFQDALEHGVTAQGPLGLAEAEAGARLAFARFQAAADAT